MKNKIPQLIFDAITILFLPFFVFASSSQTSLSVFENDLIVMKGLQRSDIGLTGSVKATGSSAFASDKFQANAATKDFSGASNESNSQTASPLNALSLGTGNIAVASAVVIVLFLGLIYIGYSLLRLLQ